MWNCQRESGAFYAATRSVAHTQQEILRTIVANNSGTSFGQQHDFSSILNIADFQRRVPLSTYDSYSTAVEQIADGQDNVLTTQRVELLEPTSGSTCGEKLIPYTASLRSQFQRAVAVWIADVMRQRPAIRRGRAYWSISPAMGATRSTPGGIPVGFDDDAAYLSRMERLFLKHLLVMPPGIARLTSMENFRYCTLFHLLAAADLTLISVWSPTFLTSLLSELAPWSDRLSGDLRRGRATLPVSDDSGANESVLANGCVKARAEQVCRILCSDESLPDKLGRLWPQLDLISCWADSTAGTYVRGVRELFPIPIIQPKGLMSTEACVSFPLFGHAGGALSLRSHFFEFIPASDSRTDNSTQLADQLDVGRQYEVVVTTGGGLYRYRSMDVVEVVEHIDQCPLLRFVGRTNRGSDLVGEKLDESFVSQVLQRVCLEHNVSPRFAMLVPVATPAGYRFYLEPNKGVLIQAAKAAILRDTESGLRENPHYRYAVNLGQLQPLELRIVDETQPSLWQTYERVLMDRGQKAGEIKPAALDSWIGWHDEFESIKTETKPSIPAIKEKL